MFARHTKLRSVIIAAAMLAIVGGAVLAAVVVTNNVSATVTVQVTAPDGVEVYLDEGLTQIGTLIDFGDVNADVFGTIDGDPPAVPVWIKNVSFSDIRLSLSDDFPHGDVRFQSGAATPILIPDQVLAGVFLLEFAQGVGGTFNFAVAVEAEGPLGIPDPSGSVTIAVDSVNSPNGLPRFCSAGCSETIYLSGITETLFNSLANSDGTVTTEPMLALDFTLDPSLEFGDFTLREGVMFHRDAGEMTAEDVAFSFNDANAVTSPGSIHGQAGDFSPLIQSMEAIDTHKVRLNYRNYDSRGMLHRFSMFWQSAGIVSKNVFDTVGVAGMQDLYIGTGAFVADEWTQNKGIFLTANPNYWGTEDGLGPYLDKVNWLEVPEGAARRAMLETGEVQITQAPTKDLPDLIAKGFEAQKGGLHNVIRDISFTGNYWEAIGALSGAALERDRDISKPWVGNPFENGDEYDENTPSMQNARKVRNAFAWSIQRAEMVDNILGGLGFENHQAYLSTSNPNYRQEWSWGTDFTKSKQLMTDAGQSGGFEMDIWVGTGELGAEIGESLGATWDEQLGVKTNLIKTGYSNYRTGLVARSTNTPGVFICGDENHSNYPYDWAHGFVVSSASAGGYGVGQEVPYATAAYFAMAGEVDKAKREELAATFYTENREWANCVGIVEEPLWPMFDPDEIVAWDQRPNANGNLYGINNVRSIRLNQ